MRDKSEVSASIIMNTIDLVEYMGTDFPSISRLDGNKTRKFLNSYNKDFNLLKINS